MSWLLALPAIGRAGAAPSSPPVPPEGRWHAIESEIGWTILGLGADGGVLRLAEALADRTAAFDAVVGLEGPESGRDARQPLILWIEDPAVAARFGAAAGWVRPLGHDEIWIVTGSVDELLPDLEETYAQFLLDTRGAGLPGFLQVALLDLLRETTIVDTESGSVALVGSHPEFVVALRDVEEWESLVAATATPWESIPPEIRDVLRPQGWAFVHYFLLARDEGPQELQEALDVARRGAVFPAALQQAIIRPPDKLVEKVVRPYVERGELEGKPPMRIATPVEIRSVDVSYPRVLRDFGRLQLLRDRRSDAAILYRRAGVLERRQAAQSFP